MFAKKIKFEKSQNEVYIARVQVSADVLAYSSALCRSKNMIARREMPRLFLGFALIESKVPKTQFIKFRREFISSDIRAYAKHFFLLVCRCDIMRELGFVLFIST